MLFTDRDLDALFPNFDDRTGAYERTALTMRTFLLAVATNTKSGIKFGPENGIQEAIEIWKGRSIEAVPLEITATFTHLSGQRVTDITVPPTNCHFSWSRKVPRIVFDRILADNEFLVNY